MPTTANTCQPSTTARRCTLHRPWLVQPWPAGYCRTFRSFDASVDHEENTCCSRGVLVKAVRS